jgi:Atypical Arm repeat
MFTHFSSLEHLDEFKQCVEKANGLCYLAELQRHEQDNIYAAACKIVYGFFHA